MTILENVGLSDIENIYDDLPRHDKCEYVAYRDDENKIISIIGFDGEQFEEIHLKMIWTRPGDRRKGYGTQLLRELIEDWVPVVIEMYDPNDISKRMVERERKNLHSKNTQNEMGKRLNSVAGMINLSRTVTNCPSCGFLVSCARIDKHICESE